MNPGIGESHIKNHAWSERADDYFETCKTMILPWFKGLTHAQAYRLARQLLDEAFGYYRRNPKMKRLGCRTHNCFGCCLYQVEVDTSLFEVNRILDKVENEGKLELTVKRAERLASHGKGGVCPLLVDGRCSVYKIRPLSCAAYHSLDREACHQGTKAKIKHNEMLWIETCVIAGIGMVGFEAATGDGPRPRYSLFESLAERGRARLDKREAA